MGIEMKDSGVKWIGEIPKDWGVKKLKFVAEIQTGNTPSMTGKINYYDNGEHLWVKPDNLNEFKTIRDTDQKLNNVGKRESRIAKPGAMLVCCIGNIGKWGVSDIEVSFNQQINSVFFNENLIINKYGIYFFSTQENQLDYYSNGNVVKILNMNNHKKVSIPIPSLKEQQQIAKYLDEQRSNIDNVISLIKESINKYKEYKKSLIHETVTKGLDKNVKLKDSGIEWIGKIPSNWNLNKIKHNYIFEVGGTPPSKNEMYYGGNNIWVTIQDMNKDEILDSKQKLSESGINKSNLSKVLKGSLLYSFKLSVGKTTWAGIDLYTNEAIASFNITSEGNLNYLKYASYLIIFNSQTNIYGANLLNQELIKNAKIVYPPLKEQKEIAEYLDKKTKEIDEIILKKEQYVEKLEEYKKSLIFELVTGKKEI